MQKIWATRGNVELTTVIDGRQNKIAQNKFIYKFRTHRSRNQYCACHTLTQTTTSTRWRMGEIQKLFHQEYLAIPLDSVSKNFANLQILQLSVDQSSFQLSLIMVRVLGWPILYHCNVFITKKYLCYNVWQRDWSCKNISISSMSVIGRSLTK